MNKTRYFMIAATLMASVAVGSPVDPSNIDGSPSDRYRSRPVR